jgi:hypothetical protein
MLTVWLVPLVPALLLADFLSGLVHWLEDSYGDPEMPIIGKYVIAPNVLHHFEPRAFTQSPLGRRNRSLWVLVALIMVGIWLAGALTPFWVWVGFFGAISNEVHVWAHRTPRENGPLITALQRWHVVQGPRHHAVHHTDPKRETFCVITELVNPVLDGTKFFRKVESAIQLLTGVSPRPDASVGPGRAMAREQLYGTKPESAD